MGAVWHRGSYSYGPVGLGYCAVPCTETPLVTEFSARDVVEHTIPAGLGIRLQVGASPVEVANWGASIDREHAEPHVAVGAGVGSDDGGQRDVDADGRGAQSDQVRGVGGAGDAGAEHAVLPGQPGGGGRGQLVQLGHGGDDDERGGGAGAGVQPQRDVLGGAMAPVAVLQLRAGEPRVLRRLDERDYSRY